MLKLAANMHFMFADVPPLDRVSAAADAGFEGVEVFLFNGMTVRQLRRRLDETGVQLVQIYANPGDFDRGDRGLAIYAKRVPEFRASILQAIEDASDLGCSLINCLVGITAGPAEEDAERSILVENLAWAAAECGKESVSVLIEPISNQGSKYVLRYTAHARRIIDAVNSPHLKLLYDIYHAQALEGNIAETISANMDVIGHIQVADLPGRHEPGTGELNYGFLFERIEELGYDGWVGCEYQPAGATIDGLTWAEPYLGTRS